MFSSSDKGKGGGTWGSDSQYATERSSLLATSNKSAGTTAAGTGAAAVTAASPASTRANTTRYLEDSVRVARESNELGMEIAVALDRQAETLDASHANVLDVSSMMGTAGVFIKEVRRRFLVRRFRLYFIATVLFVLNAALVVYLYRHGGRLLRG